MTAIQRSLAHLRVSCHRCGKVLRVPATLAGRKVLCPSGWCRARVEIPRPTRPEKPHDWRLFGALLLVLILGQVVVFKWLFGRERIDEGRQLLGASSATAEAGTVPASLPESPPHPKHSAPSQPPSPQRPPHEEKQDESRRPPSENLRVVAWYDAGRQVHSDDGSEPDVTLNDEAIQRGITLVVVQVQLPRFSLPLSLRLPSTVCTLRATGEKPFPLQGISFPDAEGRFTVRAKTDSQCITCREPGSPDEPYGLLFAVPQPSVAPQRLSVQFEKLPPIYLTPGALRERPRREREAPRPPQPERVPEDDPTPEATPGHSPPLMAAPRSGSPGSLTGSPPPPSILPPDIARRRAIIDQRYYEWDLWHRRNDPEKKRQNQMERDLQRSLHHPPPTEIWSGDALNAVLRDLQRAEAAGICGPDVPMHADILRHIDVTTGVTYAGAGTLKSLLRFNWPIALQRSAYAEQRQEVEERLGDAVSLVRSGDRVEAAILDRLDSLLKGMEEKVNRDAPALPPSEFIGARRYLEELKKSLKVLQDPNAVNYFNTKWQAQGGTIAELVHNMTEQGLRFAAAPSGSESAYTALHSKLVAYHTRLRQHNSR